MRHHSSVAIEASFIFPDGGEALQFFKPVLDEDHLGHRRGLGFLHLHLQIALAIQRPSGDCSG
jgi:hypothetical protein